MISAEAPAGLAEADHAAAIERARGVRAVLGVDLAAIVRNAGLIRRFARGARIMAVIKGDAYGLGAVPVARTLRGVVEAFAVDNVAEAIELRAAGIREPILVIDGDLPDNASAAVRYGLEPGIAQEALLHAYDAAARAAGVRHPVWLVANVGFNRSGHGDPERFETFARRAAGAAGLRVRGVYAHLTSSHLDPEATRAEAEAFGRLVAVARGVLGPSLETSLLASHGIGGFARYAGDWVRPGVLLYGEHGHHERAVGADTAALLAQLEPAISLSARVIHLLRFEVAEGVGYGRVHETRPGQRLATVSIGFGGGYPRGAFPGFALVRGRRAPLFGAVGMDALQIDVTGIREVGLYNRVTLIGRDGGERITARELADAAGLSIYELLRGLRTQRAYAGDA